MDNKPTKSASKGDWTDYALANGKTEEDLDGLTRDEIAAQFADDADNAPVDPEAAKEEAYQAGEAMTDKGANPLVKAGAEDLPPHLRAGAVHRAITE